MSTAVSESPYLLIIIQDLLDCVARRMERLETTMKEMMETLSKERHVLKKTLNLLELKWENTSYINSVNLLRLPSRDAYSHGLQLMDIIFTKRSCQSHCSLNLRRVRSLDLTRIW